MPIVLSDSEIQNLINEPKPLPENYCKHIHLKPKRGHKEFELDIDGIDGTKFRVILRQSSVDAFDFSAILAYHVPKTNVLFRLRRYNGKSHEHTNKLEKEKFFGFHIHQATERYQSSGMREDEYAIPTDSYANLDDALRCLFKDCSFEMPPGEQMELF